MKRLLRKLCLTKQERRLLEYGTKNLRPMSESLPEDIFIAGYPKSGNTWFQNLVAGVVFGILQNKSHPRLMVDLVPDIHEGKLYYKRYQTPTYFKTHHKPLPEYRNVVYLLRDGRDVMVSYWHHLQALEGKEINFIEMVRSGQGLYPCKWQEHVAAWMANPYQARMIVIKYEDLLAEPVAQLERFCAFAGIEADRSFLETISQGATFKNLQTRERVKGEERWPKDKLFHRRGVAGSFRDEMPPEVLQAFEAEAKETLEQQGYVL